MKLFRKFSIPMATLVCCVLGFAAQAGAGSDIITTIVGGGEAGGPLGDGGPATSAVLNNPTSVILDSAGNFYIADERNYRIRKVDTSGIISTIAGTGESGNSGDGGPAIEAKMSPEDIALDSSGNLYILGSSAEYGVGIVRKVDPAGVITTVAGGGHLGILGDDSLATEVTFSFATGIHVDEAGNLYIADAGASRIRKVDPTGIITTVAGNGTGGYSGDGGAAIDASLGSPQDIFVDNNGDLYIAERFNGVIRKVDPSGIITTVAGNGNNEARLSAPNDIFVDGGGNLYIASSSEIRRVDPSGIITTIAGGGFGDLGDGGPATEATLNNPAGIFVDGSGNLYIADTGNNRIRKVAPASFQIALTATPDFILELESSTIRAEIQDRDGNLQSDDNSTVVTFRITSGEGTLSDEEVTASGGVATTTLTSETVGVVNIVAGAPDSEDGILSVEVKGPQVVISLTADPSIVTADGSDASTLRVEVRDLSGNLKTGDNSTVVTFRIMGGFVSEGGGSLSFESVTASGGVATTTFRGSMPGQVIVEAAASGAREVTVIVSVLRVPSQTGPFGPPPVLEIGPGEIGTIAGGWIGDGGPATEAGLSSPRDLFVDGAGNLYIADNGNNRIRKVHTSGIITTVAGTGDKGFKVDEGGPATDAQIALPLAVTVDALGNIYLAQFRTVWKVDTSGIITRVAGSGSILDTGGDGEPATDTKVEGITAIAVDGSGNLFIAQENNRIRKVDPSGIISTAASVDEPLSLAVDASGNLYILRRDRSRSVTLVAKMAPSGTITTIAGGGGGGGILIEGSPATEFQLLASSISVDAAGNLYILGNDRVLRVDLSGALTTVAANIGRGTGIALNSAGEVYFADDVDHRVRKIGTDGSIVTVAGSIGDGRPATQVSFISPQGITMDNAGNIYIADSGNGRVRRVDPTGTISTVAGGGTARGSGFPFIEFVGPATEAALNPSGLALDASGNLYVVEWQGHRIRKVDTSGIITTVGGTGTQGFSGDGGAATGAKLNQPYGVFADGSGSLYIADQGNNRVRKVDPSGTITTVAGKSGSGPLEENIPAIEANLFGVSAVFVDGSGNLFIALGSRVVKVDLSGIITTVAGDRIADHVGDGGPATAAAMQPADIFVDDLGDLYIADTRHNRIRKVRIIPSQTTDTPAGTDVPIAFSAQTLGAAPVSMTFGQVTQAGETTLETSGSGPATPGGFRLIDPSVFYQITTTAAFEGSIELCLDYTGLNVTNESELKLFHLENSVWADVTTSQDTQEDVICGSVTSLSPFALFETPLPPPQPDFAADTTAGVDSLTVKFTDTSVGSVTAWVWSFGDGDSSFVQNPTHTYTVGTFTVILTATGPGGSNTIGKADLISVLEGVKADFSPDTTSGRVPLVVTFSDPSTGTDPLSTWLWTFGDGDSSRVQHPTHTYTEANSYDVTLTVTAETGTDTKTVQDLIVVTPNLSPTAPVPLSPADGAIRVPLSPTLSWGSSIDPEGDPVSYDVFLGTDRVGSTSDTTQMVGPLDEDTGYTWHIVSKDDRGGSAEGATRAFTTVGDTLPPVVTRDPVVEAIRQSGFRVVWRVDERSTPSVSYRVSGETTFTTSPEGSLGRDQRVDVTDLSSATTYEFRVTSRDSSGNETTFPDPPYPTATTLAEADTEGPLFTVLPAAEHVSDTVIVVVWKTNESSTTELLYRVESDTAFVTGPAGAAGTNHRGAIGGLTPGTSYVLRARSVDASGNPSVGPDLTVTTAPPVVESIPIRVSNVSVVGRTESQAIIDWSTNQPGSSVVEYGLGSTLRTSQTETGEDGVLEHRVTLSRLTDDTPYFYRAISGTDTSDVFSFRTRKAVPPVPAVITEGPLVRGIGEDRATVLWKTDVLASSRVEFDTTENSLTQTVSDPDGVTDHAVTLTGLSASTTYFYRVASVNLSRLTTESDVFSFRTLDAPDTTPPSILELSVPVRTSDGFTVTWRTNEIGTSEVIYAEDGGSEQSRIAPGFAVDHSLSLSGLSAETTYVIRVRSADPAGNGAESEVQEVTTLSEAVVDVSSPRLVRAPSAAGSSHEGATIVWGTDEPGNSLVAYGVSEDDLPEEQGDSRRFTTDHSVRLTNLESAEIYFFQVSSTDAFGNGPTIGTGTFTTQAAPDTISVSITEGPTVVSVTDESAVLSWKTNELSDTQVDYAAGLDPTAAGLTQRIILPGAVTDHQVTLTNLSPSTGYAFRAGSQDVARNPRTFSTDRTFTTEATPDTIPPDLVGAVTISERTSTTITLIYTTDEPTNTVVELWAIGLQPGTHRAWVPEADAERDVDGIDFGHGVPVSDQFPGPGGERGDDGPHDHDPSAEYPAAIR